MTILESPLMGEFIAYLKAYRSGRSRVDQRRRRLCQLVAMVRAVTDAAEGRVRDGSLYKWLRALRAGALRGQEVLNATGCDATAVAGSARQFLDGLKALFVSSAEADKLTEAVEELEILAGPGGDLDRFMELLRLVDGRATGMDVDGHAPVDAARHCYEASSSAGSVEVPGAKRKRAPTSVVDGGSTWHGQLDSVERPKRRVRTWTPPRNRKLTRRRRRRPTLGQCLTRLSL